MYLMDICIADIMKTDVYNLKKKLGSVVTQLWPVFSCFLPRCVIHGNIVQNGH